MSLSSEIAKHFPEEVDSIKVDKYDVLYGEKATTVTVFLDNGKTVTGTFTDHPRTGFGGVDFAGPKDIVGLMVTKVRQVLEGKA